MVSEISKVDGEKEQVTLPAPVSLIEQADIVAKRMEEANKVAAELLARQESIAARNLLSGKAEAGQAIPQVSEEDKIKQGMKNYFKGTAIENAIK